MSDFSVKFRGVRGSFPVADRNFLDYGGNTSCVEVNAGGHLIILDAGTGIVKIGDELLENYISSSLNPEQRTPVCASVLLSHIHSDHIMGLTFFKPMHLKSTSLNIFGFKPANSDLKTDLSNLLFGKTFPIDLNDVACNCEINNLEEETAILYKKGKSPVIVSSKNIEHNPEDVVVTFYKSYVHPQEGVMVYKITYKNKSLVYATDKECYFGGDKKFINFAKNCDLLIHDTQYTAEDYLNPNSPKQGYGHSTFDMAVESMKQSKARNLVFFHYDPSYDDSKLNNIGEYYTSMYQNVKLAREGLEICLV